MKTYHQWLHDELRDWLSEGLIDNAQAQRLRARYPLAPSRSWARVIFSSLGAILIGLGVILLFAYNWQQMHKFVKLAVIFSALIGAHGAALWCRRHRPKQTALAEGLQVLGTLIFGAGIWLVAQIYHIDEHYPNAFLAWGLGALAMAWVLPSLAHGVIATLLLLLWHASEVFDFHVANHGGAVLLLVGVVGLAWRLRSQMLLSLGGAAIAAALVLSVSRINDDLILPMLFCIACILLAVHSLTLKSQHFAGSRAPLRPLGLITYFALLYLLTFHELAERAVAPDLQTSAEVLYLLSVALPAAVLWLGLLIDAGRGQRWRGGEWLQHGLIALTLGMLLGAIAVHGYAPESRSDEFMAGFAAVVFNIALFLHGCALIIEGAKQGDASQATTGCVLVALIVATRYIDLFDSLLLRSLAFFIVGGIVFATGNFYARHRLQAHEETV